MSESSIPKRYTPEEIERKLNAKWLETKAFHADVSSDKPGFSLVIPPPNVTGSLHVGHALNNTLQDILCRWKRMSGFEVLWVPGTDHAGIATQNVVEKQLLSEGKKRDDLGREAFIERVWKWKEESGGTIINQLKRLGASCDWQRERFTMDEGLSKAVRKVFVSLYNDGLIYQGEYLISWCPRCHTALSDLEVDHKEVDGALYHLVYPNDFGAELIVATTRPETVAGDTALAVNPNDPEKSHLIGKKVRLPLFDREVPVIGDEHVDMTFGTGVLKVTPGHDPNDFAIGKRHQLEVVNIMNADGTMNEHAGKYQGQDRFECRKAFVEDMKEAGLLVKVEKRPHAVGHCYRCHTIVEPRVSQQWFVSTKTLAEKAIEVVEKGQVRFYPENRKKLYFEWMRNINDWCISRQIWWGHRIPAWECADCGKYTVAESDPAFCEHCKGRNLEQESDVLDTWFSSGLWAFSTMGWPEETEELKRFYPTSVLVTAFDILFFWVARMVMMGLKMKGEVPFHHVYIHALVLDEAGQKMSKSRGNVIDPLVIIDQYGADALRFTLAALTMQGRDIKLSTERIEGFRNFCNKIWNASRFVQMNIPSLVVPAAEEIEKLSLSVEDKWIVSHLQQTIRQVDGFLTEYRFSEAAMALYAFFRHKFCDWYIEMIKGNMAAEGHPSRAVVSYVLDASLKLLHPFIPYITEEIWCRMHNTERCLTHEPFPKVSVQLDFSEVMKEIDLVIEVVSKTRTLRGEHNISPKTELETCLVVSDSQAYQSLLNQKERVQGFCRASVLSLVEDESQVASELIRNSYRGAGSFYEIFIQKEEKDSRAERERLEKEKAKTLKEIAFLEKKLSNRNFVDKAPESVVARTRDSLKEQQIILEKIEKFLALDG